MLSYQVFLQSQRSVSGAAARERRRRLEPVVGHKTISSKVVEATVALAAAHPLGILVQVAGSVSQRVVVVVVRSS